MPLTIGIDVGGTNTDAVLVSARGVHKKAKIPTIKDNLLQSVLEALEAVYDPHSEKNLERICISTTLTTNSIVEENYDKVGLLCLPGPGLHPKYLPFHESMEILPGYVDHRGRIVKDLNPNTVRQAVEKFLKKDIKRFAVVGKFSNRNPELEMKIHDLIIGEYSDVKHISLGHRVTSRIGFPRRIATAYLNAAVYRKHKEFADAVENALGSKGITAPVFILKGDGGTINLEASRRLCVHTILSGPAASIMGEITLTGEHPAAALIDIGGTTTDIAIMLNGSPVFERSGAEISGYKTSVRALFSRSIGIGGDSAVKVENGVLQIGPHREGPAVIFGGNTPTPTDAAAALGKVPCADPKIAKEALKPLADSLNVTIKKTAELIIEETAQSIADAIKKIVVSLSNRPVYTVKEVLEPLVIELQKLIGMGGPSPVLAPLVAEKLGIDCEIAPVHQVANAVGAAAARPTTVATVHCDTSTGYYSISELGIKKEIGKKNWNIDKITAIAKKAVEKRAKSRTGYQDIDFSREVEITTHEEFNVVRGFQTVGKIMEVKAQIKPGAVFSLTHWKEGEENDHSS